MRWGFILPGQPPSWNDSYQIVRRYGRGGKSYMSLAKKEKAELYQSGATLIIRSARPSGWRPAHQVRVYYWLRLKRDIDCDNVMKSIHDAIQMATQVDDKLFLPCVVEKTTGCEKPEVEIVIEDPASPSVGLPGSSDILTPSSTSSAPSRPKRRSSSDRRARRGRGSSSR